MAKNATAPQVPGAAPAADPQEDPIAAAPAANAPAAGGDETVAVPKAQLDALLARVAALESSAQRPAAKRANPDADLPDQDSIDLATMKNPVLTKQGWLVPEKFGSHPNAKP